MASSSPPRSTSQYGVSGRAPPSSHPFHRNGWEDGGARPEPPYCDVDLGGLLLANPAPGYRQQVRQGVIDPNRHVYYVPYQGLQPVAIVTDNEVLPQYLFEVDLDRVLSAANEPGRCP